KVPVYEPYSPLKQIDETSDGGKDAGVIMTPIKAFDVETDMVTTVVSEMFVPMPTQPTIMEDWFATNPDQGFGNLQADIMPARIFDEFAQGVGPDDNFITSADWDIG
ncbi:MAG: hypothetical protein NXH72_15975, partial [Hyphomonadaceae bacterium]|nr:hypothetical protein [Hyphomonadaceae bacterium]